MAPESQHLYLGLCSGFHRRSLETLAQHLEKQIIFLTTFVKGLLATRIQKITASSGFDYSFEIFNECAIN